ncbi:MAG: C40 family peptidase [Mizugakiibacter sp.]|uniref:C40 family peptidase n=1 Tax=Mizugakiibacter sp. TaxID=1972610 RepID=UPI0031C27064|nr:C40 family peptidase [Xanthomonadaceae bacterium]
MRAGKAEAWVCSLLLALGALPAAAAPSVLASPSASLPLAAMTVPFFAAEHVVAPSTDAAPAPADETTTEVRRLVDTALLQRDVRYRFGGRDPSGGFDCSGFVHYVFAQALGLDLPPNSAAQFRVGERVDRDAMRTGDLVFFRDRHGRINHVGIYLDDGRFIHSPSRGERVRVDSLAESYWARRFAGAKRMDALAQR